MLGKLMGIAMVGLGLGLALATAACDSEEDDSIVACYYEERSSACGGGGYGSWESKCIDIENGMPCASIVKSDTVCESSCCVNFEVRDLEEVSGASCDE